VLAVVERHAAAFAGQHDGFFALQVQVDQRRLGGGMPRTVADVDDAGRRCAAARSHTCHAPRRGANCRAGRPSPSRVMNAGQYQLMATRPFSGPPVAIAHQPLPADAPTVSPAMGSAAWPPRCAVAATPFSTRAGASPVESGATASDDDQQSLHGDGSVLLRAGSERLRGPKPTSNASSLARADALNAKGPGGRAVRSDECARGQSGSRAARTAARARTR
jgi:hypothetical protein